MSAKNCEMFGCNRPARAAGLCLHHFDMSRKGDPALSETKAAIAIRASHEPEEIEMQNGAKKTADKGTCRVPGCDKPARTRGICEMHYNHRNADTALGAGVRTAMVPSKTTGRKGAAAKETPDKGICRVPGCDKPAKGRGVCYAHYAHRNDQNLVGEQVRLSMAPSTRGQRKQAGRADPIGTGTKRKKAGAAGPAAAETLPETEPRSVTMDTNDLAMLGIVQIGRGDGDLLISDDGKRGIFVPLDEKTGHTMSLYLDAM